MTSPVTDHDSLLHSALDNLIRVTTSRYAAGALVCNGAVTSVKAMRTIGGTVVPLRDELSFDISSQTKLISTIALLQLASNGAVDLNRPIHSLLPSVRFRDSGLGQLVTVDHCLRHSSGLGHATTLSARGPLAAFGVAMRRQRNEPVDVSRSGVLPVHFAPGSRQRYSNIGASLLAEVVESITQTPYSAAVQQLIFDPYGMTNTSAKPGAIPELRAAWPIGRLLDRAFEMTWKGVSGVISTAHDLARMISPYTTLASRVDTPFAALLAESIQPVGQNDRALPGHVAGWRRDDFNGSFTIHEAGARPGITLKSVVLPQQGAGVVLVTAKSARAEIHGAASALADALAGTCPPVGCCDVEPDEALFGTWELCGGCRAYPLFALDCGRRLHIAGRSAGAPTVAGRTFSDVPLLQLEGGGVFQFRGAHITLHLADQTKRELVVGGPYTGVRLRRINTA